jgi:Uma2 family endonuclease
MTTRLKLGPADKGRPLSDEEYTSADFAEGYDYELIHGRLYVAARPNYPHGRVEKWLFNKLSDYSRQHPEVSNSVEFASRVFLPTSPEEVTAPEPDLAAYHDFPLDDDPENVRWQDATPVLVVEVVSEDDPDKDFVRNVELYLQVPTIREYWILDPRQSAWQPTLLVYRRRGQRWQRPIAVGGGETYTTRLLPGFSLTLDIRA